MIEIEPDRAREREPVVVGVREARLRSTTLSFAAASMRNAGYWRHSFGTLACAGRCPRHLRGGDAQRVVGGEAPDFFARPFAAGVSGRDSVRHAGAAREQDDLVAAGAKLHAQRAVTLEASRQIALQRQWREAVGQARPSTSSRASPATLRRMRVSR
jgi:hypothetical protein